MLKTITKRKLKSEITKKSREIVQLLLEDIKIFDNIVIPNSDVKLLYKVISLDGVEQNLIANQKDFETHSLANNKKIQFNNKAVILTSILKYDIAKNNNGLKVAGNNLIHLASITFKIDLPRLLQDKDYFRTLYLNQYYPDEFLNYDLINSHFKDIKKSVKYNFKSIPKDNTFMELVYSKEKLEEIKQMYKEFLMIIEKNTTIVKMLNI